MATRSRTTFQKRQKELARKEKQRMKAERRAQRKLEPQTETSDLMEIEPLSPPDDVPPQEGPAGGLTQA